MRIGVIGAGEVAQSFASKAVDAGHSIVLSNSRGAQTLALLVTEFGPLAHQSGASGER
jgi:predicted dinucleotide-binding enzyme